MFAILLCIDIRNSTVVIARAILYAMTMSEADTSHFIIITLYWSILIACVLMYVPVCQTSDCCWSAPSEAVGREPSANCKYTTYLLYKYLLCSPCVCRLSGSCMSVNVLLLVVKFVPCVLFEDVGK